MCVYEGEREGEGERGKEREGEGEREFKRTERSSRF